MKKSEIVKDMKAFTGSAFINRSKFARYLGVQPKHADKYLVGLERIGRMYFIPDVAEALLKEAEVR